MNRVVMLAVLGVFASAFAPGARAADQPETEDVRAGRALSLRLCTACHIVSPDQEMAPILEQPAPSFRAIANRAGTTEESLRRFISETHSSMNNVRSMPNLHLTDDQIREAAAFLMSLKRQR